MTVNGEMAFILHYLTEFGSFWADYVKVAEERPTLSATENVVQRI